jgi:predicted dehydrogenase
MRIGIICPSEIALRRFMPALQKCDNLTFAGIGVFTKEESFGSEGIDDATFTNLQNREKQKAQVFIDQYGGKIFEGYATIASSPEIDALYIPLPPALHYRWAKYALEHGKHVFVEKPATMSFVESQALINLAAERKLAFHENYMFVFHSQLNAIDKIIKSGEIGDIRLYRISFGFPRRSAIDFRYNKLLGGGALIDAGGYTIRYATKLLEESTKILSAQSNYINEFNVDIFGSAMLTNDEGITAQVAFGMDNDYKCELEIWGSKGSLTTGRILTAPTGFVPTATIRKENVNKVIELPNDDAFLKSMEHFIKCTQNECVRKQTYATIAKQAELVDYFKKLSNWK